MSSTPVNTTSTRFKSFCRTNNDLPASDRGRDRFSESHFEPRRQDHIPQSLASLDATNEDGNNPVLNDNTMLRHEPRLKCCCGRPNCAYLEHNDAALGGIEKDLETAARLGQALLNRHESYITESQYEHARLTSQIAEIEFDRNSLQTANERIVAENRELLSQLESLNTSLKDSDGHVKNLEDLLKDCESEVERLNALARRTEQLELRVLDMESERVILARKLEDGEQESKTMLKRWRDSERRVKELEVEVQKIEWEAKLELEKHEEVVARLERERVLERELGGAEGRLKGAAALQSMTSNTSNPAVVSNFVRDILQDNASLQAGIVELRDLLQSSNEEVQNLRDQVLQHQPIENADSSPQMSSSVPLDEQMGWQSPTPQQQREVHVHHHYHAKLAPKKDRTTPIRRPSRRRPIMNGGIPDSPRRSSSPSTPTLKSQRFISSPALPMHINHPRQVKNRWSVQSGATASSAMSSLPSSPRSYHARNSSIFDRLEMLEDSSRPTSPESVVGPASPPLGYRESKGLQIDTTQLDSFHEFEEDLLVVVSTPVSEKTSRENGANMLKVNHEDETSAIHDLTPKPSQVLTTPKTVSIIPPEPRPPDPKPIVEAIDNSEAKTSSRDQTYSSTLSQLPEIRPSIRRSSSHDSLLSISGMDIHLARRPAGSSPFTLLRGNSAHFAQSPSQARKLTAAQPLASVTEFTASGNANTSIATKGLNTSLQALSGIVKDHPYHSTSNLSTSGSISTTQQQQQPSTGLGKLGGWVLGKWGIAPTTSSNDIRSNNKTFQRRSSSGNLINQIKDSTISSTSSSSSTAKNDTNTTTNNSALNSMFAGRPPGINQKGIIPGLWSQNIVTPIKVHGQLVDEVALREGLAE